MTKLEVPPFVFLIFVFFLISSCKTSEDENDDKNATTDTFEFNSELTNNLVVEGDLIPVYSNADMKEQLFSLNTGDKCKIIEKGSFAIVLGLQDFWYHIDFKGQKGWIFGAYSSLKQNSEFEVFLREFNKVKSDTLSRKLAIAFLNGRPGFKPLEYKRLENDYYAALFYSEIVYPSVELLLIIYESGKSVKEFSLFKGDISNCTKPEAFFTSPEFIKYKGPSCGTQISPILYYQILEDYSIKEVKSSIIAKKSDDLIPAINRELKIVDATIADESECTVHSTIREGYVDKDFIFYTIIRDECKTFCTSRNSTLIALPDSNQWIIKFEKLGGFKAIYKSGIEDKFIVVLEEFVQNHIVERIEREKLYLFDPKLQTLKELNIKSESCIILSPKQYGCEYCNEHSTHSEELIIKGNPVKEVIKKITNFYYDESNSCMLINQNSRVINYTWIPEQARFVIKSQF